MWLYVPSACAPVSAVSTWDSSALERLAASATSSGKHSAPRVWSQRCNAASWPRLLSGVTCEPSTLERGVAAWISSLADTRASLSARQDCGEASPTPGTCGPKSCGSTARAEPATCSAKTSSDTFRLGSPLSLPTLPKWGRMSSGACSPRPTLERRIAGSGSSSWPTATAGCPDATAANRGGRKNPTLMDVAAKFPLWPTARTSGANGAGSHGEGGMDLRTRAAMWPTPDAFVSNDGEQPDTFLARKAKVKESAQNGNGMGTPLAMSVKLWSTPRASDGEKGGPNMSFGAGGTPLPAQASLFLPAPRTSMDGSGGSQPEAQRLPSSPDAQLPMIWRHSSVTLCAALRRGLTDGHDASTQRERLLQLSDLHSKRGLNPRFVESLMGFPCIATAWTAFAPSATPSSRKSRRSRSASSGAATKSEGDDE